MKKTYIQPEMLAVVLLQQSNVLQSVSQTGGNSDVSFGGSSDNMGVNDPGQNGGCVKEHNVWDNEW